MTTIGTPLTGLRSLSKATKPIRILVVDDSVVMRQLITRMLLLDPAFVVVGSARNGLDALAKVELLQPDLVTLDVEMPELDGVGALRLMQQRFPRVRVIMCSSLTERGAAVTIDALLAGADDYVTKQLSGEMSASAFDTLKSELTAKIRQLFRLDAPPGAGAKTLTARAKTASTIGICSALPAWRSELAAWKRDSSGSRLRLSCLLDTFRPHRAH